jgi:hypothetical protein
MFRSDDKPCGQDSVLCDLMEGLFHIAAADGTYHPARTRFWRAWRRSSASKGRCSNACARVTHPDGPPDPYAVLGVDPDADLETVRAAWRAEVRATHPDRMLARGMPGRGRETGRGAACRGQRGLGHDPCAARRGLTPMRIATYNVEWFHELFDRTGSFYDDGPARAAKGQPRTSDRGPVHRVPRHRRRCDHGGGGARHLPPARRRNRAGEFRAARRASAPVRCCMVSPTRRSRSSCCSTIPM